MVIPYFQINAFTDRPFRGNPAGVCILSQSLPESLLQAIATENNLSETAFCVRVRAEDVFHLRWFTPAREVDLCGHATLATAHVLFSEIGHREDTVRFQTQSGLLSATRRSDIIELDFPSRPPELCKATDALAAALGQPPREVRKSRDYLAVYDSQAEVESLQPNMDMLAALDCLGTIVTAPGKDCDFVSRFFAPQAGIPEDPVTGSSHCTLIPYWAGRL